MKLMYQQLKRAALKSIYSIRPLRRLVQRCLRPEQYRFYRLNKLVEKAMERRDDVRAEALAREYLTLAERFKSDWNYGNAIHYANQVLGIRALRRSEVIAAKEHLIAAGNTSGSPQLNSFGPRMRLARELVQLGETDVVVEYLNLVARFWANENRQDRLDSVLKHKSLLERWKVEVWKGQVPGYYLWS